MLENLNAAYIKNTIKTFFNAIWSSLLFANRICQKHVQISMKQILYNLLCNMQSLNDTGYLIGGE